MNNYPNNLTAIEGVSSRTPSSYLRKAEIAKLFGVSTRTIENWTASGRIPVYRFGARLNRYRIGEVEEAVKAFRRHAVTLRGKIKTRSHIPN
jgi:excisionase family DNA binding protein